MKLSDLLINIENMSESEYKAIKSISRKIITKYSNKKDLKRIGIDLDEVIDLAISQFKNRYNSEYKTAPGTFYHTVLIRRYIETYLKKVELESKEDLYYLNDYDHNKNVERALIYYDNKDSLEQDIMDLKTVSDKNKEILLLSAKGYSNSDIANLKGISRQRVSQLLKSLSNNYEIKALLKKWCMI